MSSGSLRFVVAITLLLIGLIFAVAGGLAVWLGTNGTAINDIYFHIGATTPAEMINNGIILLSVGLVALVSFTVLFVVKKNFLKFSDAKF